MKQTCPLERARARTHTQTHSHTHTQGCRRAVMLCCRGINDFTCCCGASKREPPTHAHTNTRTVCGCTLYEGLLIPGWSGTCLSYHAFVRRPGGGSPWESGNPKFADTETLEYLAVIVTAGDAAFPPLNYGRISTLFQVSSHLNKSRLIFSFLFFYTLS